MTKINKIASLFDEQAWNSDSVLAGSSLYKVNSSFVSSGTIDGSLDHDYYVIDGILLTGSNYEIHLTSDSTNHGWSSNNESTSLEFDLYDYNDNLLGSSTLDFSRSLYDDVLEFTVPSDYKSWQPYYIDVHGLVFDATDYAVTLNSVNSTPAVNNQPLGSLTISGTTKVGETLTASSSVSDADGINASTIQYEWYRGSEKIIGATDNTYTLTENDIGKTIKITKTYSDNLNNEHSVTSESTSIIEASSTNDSNITQSANDKTLIIVLDDFSERVHDYDNITLYDFGYLDLVTFYDNYYDIYTGAFSDYGNYDDLSVDLPDLVGSFYEATPDIDSTNSLDLDFVNSSTFIDVLGFTAYADTYLRFTYSDPTDETLPAHGDWVVEAINQTLDEPNKTEILCIDLDTLNSLGHFGKIFDQVNYTVDGTTYTGSNFDKIVSEFIVKNDSRLNGGTSDVTYSLAGISMSISGPEVPPSLDVQTFLTSLEQWNAPFFQSAPNVGNGVYDYSTFFPDVISVGAWNIDANEDILAASATAIPTVDLYANGVVEKDGWGINFGTSFATPTAAAALANYLNTAIAEFNASGSSISDIDVEDFEPIDQTDFTNSIIEAISTPTYIVVDDNGNRFQATPNVLNETLDGFGLTPTKANRIIYKDDSGNDVINIVLENGIDGVSVPIVSENEFVNRPATFTDVSFSGQLVPTQTITANVTIADDDGFNTDAVVTGWFLGDVAGDSSLEGKTLLSDYTTLDSTLVLKEDWTGKYLYFAKFFVDEYGNIEDSSTSGLFEAGLITDVRTGVSEGPVLTHFEIADNKLTSSDEITIYFRANDPNGLGSFSARFNHVDRGVGDDFWVNGQYENLADDLFKMTLPIQLGGSKLEGKYELTSLTILDEDPSGANTTEWNTFTEISSFIDNLDENHRTVFITRENRQDVSSSEKLLGSSLSEIFYLGNGNDHLTAGAGDDVIILSTDASHKGLFAHNVNTDTYLSLIGKSKYSSVVDGEEDADTIILMDNSNGDAFFLHDAYSDLHESVSTTSDDKGMQTAARVISVETILAGDGDDIIDLTSDTFDMRGTNITLKGEAGNDVLWAAEGQDTLDGGIGDDTLFGGDGNDILTGGDGADIFEFVNSTSAQTDTITDYTSDDTLKFYLGDGDSQITQADYQNGTLKWGNLTIAFEDRIGSVSDFDFNDIIFVYG